MASITIRSNNLDNIIVGELNVKWSARRDSILRYYVDVRHKKLNLHKEVSAPEIFILQSKMDALMASWDERYEQFNLKQNVLAGHSTAEDMTADAIKRLDSLGTILSHTLNIDDRVDWDSLKDKRSYQWPAEFDEKPPKSFSVKKPQPRPLVYPTTEPEPTPVYVEPKITFWHKVFGQTAKIFERAEDAFQTELRAWEDRERKRKSDHTRAISEHDRKQADHVKAVETWKKQKSDHVASIKSWEEREKGFWDYHSEQKAKFEEEKAATHAEVDRLRAGVSQGDIEAIIEHASLVLESSNYDGLFEKSYLIQYDRNSRLLKLSYDLPSLDILPSVKSVKFVKATGELRESYIPDREKKANFDSACYQICLRTIHELFEADVDSNVDSILFNGFVSFIDPAKGIEQRSCLLSVLVDKPSFTAIDLARVDPKACFKSLKGVSAASLASLAAIPPVMEMDTEDRRFIEAREVGSGIDEGTNLASISWDDFEHLVREIFEREFAARGGEVKVTQSSSDGGVDAVAFDPDPITGGKIVIQAKRYTRTVGVSAVRDLYGTVMNEGASRGILVTTADYGPDAYTFANGKPLTLMNGANLLHMMERHGQKARIDIKEARALLNQNES